MPGSASMPESVAAAAASACDLWLDNKAVGNLLRCADRARVSARLGKALQASLGDSAGVLCGASADTVAKMFARHLLDALHAPIPLGEDLVETMVDVASRELRGDQAFKRLVSAATNLNTVVAAVRAPSPVMARHAADVEAGPRTRSRASSRKPQNKSSRDPQAPRELQVEKLAAPKFSSHKATGDFRQSNDSSETATTGVPTCDTLPPMDFAKSWESAESAPAMASESNWGRQLSAVNGRTIIFDWDDTLMPTWWIINVMAPAMAQIKGPNPWVSSDSRALAMQADIELSKKDSRFRVPLQNHARIVEATLRAARKVSDVAIVTLALPAWFERSFQFMVGLDVQALLEELEIPVFFADRNRYADADLDNPGVPAKRDEMADLLRVHLGDVSVQWNVISIGDQTTERDALKECCRKCPAARPRPICKTLLLKTNPTLRDLTQELQILLPEIGRLALHAETDDWRFGSSGLSLVSKPKDRSTSVSKMFKLSPLRSSSWGRRA